MSVLRRISRELSVPNFTVYNSIGQPFRIFDIREELTDHGRGSPQMYLATAIGHNEETLASRRYGTPADGILVLPVSEIPPALAGHLWGPERLHQALTAEVTA